MHRLPTSLLAFAAVLSLAALGCTDDPPTPIEVRSQISSDLGNVLHETNAAFSGSTASLPGGAALAMVDQLLGTSTPVSLRVRQLVTPFVAGGSNADPPSNDLIDADASVSYFNDQLFTDANHLGNGIYQVPPSLVCSQTTVDPSGKPVKTIDQACADRLAKADLRIRVARDGGALIIAIQVDANHDEPLRFTLTHTSLAVTVDLDGMQRAIAALAALFNEDLPNVALAGQVTAKLEILGAAKLRASTTIDRDLSIKGAKTGASLDGPDALVLTSAKAEAFAVTLDGNAKSGSFAVDLGETTMKLPAFTNNKRFELDLPGATANATFTAGQPLTLTQVGLGNHTTTVSLDGARAETIDINPHDGRVFDATVSRDPTTGKETFTVTPKVDLELSVDHTVLGDTPPVYDVTQVLLYGSVRTSDASNQIEVVTGSFGVATSPAGHGFTASAGQCVTSSSAIDPATSRSYTQYTAGACH
jgi:hypothetical protein